MAKTSQSNVRRKSANMYVRSRSQRSQDILMVSARAGTRKAERMQKAGVLTLMTLVLFGVVGVAWAGIRGVGSWLYTGNDRYQLERVEVETTGRLQADHILEYGRIQPGDNLFALDLDDIRNQLELVPLIRRAELQIQLPHTLMVRITERKPVARVGAGPRQFPLTVDLDGYVLGPARNSNLLPLITGVQDKGLTPGSQLRDTAVIDALAVVSLCQETRLADILRIDHIDVSHPDYLDLTLASKLRVLLPRNPSKTKLEETAAILLSGHAPRSFLDMTMDSNIPGT